MAALDALPTMTAPQRLLRALPPSCPPTSTHRVCGARLLGHDERGDGEDGVVGGQRARQDAARLDPPPRVAHRVAALGRAAAEGAKAAGL